MVHILLDFNAFRCWDTCCHAHCFSDIITLVMAQPQLKSSHVNVPTIRIPRSGEHRSNMVPATLGRQDTDMGREGHGTGRTWNGRTSDDRTFDGNDIRWKRYSMEKTFDDNTWDGSSQEGFQNGDFSSVHLSLTFTRGCSHSRPTTRLSSHLLAHLHPLCWGLCLHRLTSCSFLNPYSSTGTASAGGPSPSANSTTWSLETQKK